MLESNQSRLEALQGFMRTLAGSLVAKFDEKTFQAEMVVMLGEVRILAIGKNLGLEFQSKSFESD